MARRGFSFKATKWDTVTKPIADTIANAATETADEVSLGLKGDLRAQVVGAGLGPKLANTWRGRRYPVSGASIDAAAFVFSKAPEIILAFDTAPTIHTVNGRRYLAIPTANVPLKALGRGHGRRMSPEEVELAFNQDLKFARTGKGRLIAYVDVVGTAAGGFKSPTGKQLGRLYRGQKAPPRYAQVVMFILTPTAHMHKLLTVDDIARRWADLVPSILERRLGGLS